MEAPKDGRFDDAAVGVRGPRQSCRDLLSESLMRSVAVEVSRVVGPNPFEVTLAENDDWVEALVARAAPEALPDRVGPRKPDGGAKDAGSDPGSDRSKSAPKLASRCEPVVTLVQGAPPR